MTYENMHSYYEHYAVDWDCSKIEEQIRNLVNYDLLLKGEVVGAIRLTFDNDSCYVRDLQVSHHHQNKGFGAAALAECERLAINSGTNRLKLRVFSNFAVNPRPIGRGYKAIEAKPQLLP